MYLVRHLIRCCLISILFLTLYTNLNIISDVFHFKKGPCCASNIAHEPIILFWNRCRSRYHRVLWPPDECDHYNVITNSWRHKTQSDSGFLNVCLYSDSVLSFDKCWSAKRPWIRYNFQSLTVSKFIFSLLY